MYALAFLPVYDVPAGINYIKNSMLENASKLVNFFDQIVFWDLILQLEFHGRLNKPHFLTFHQFSHLLHRMYTKQHLKM